MLLFTAFMWTATVVVGMSPGKRWHDGSPVFCQAEASPHIVSTDISITSSNSTPMQTTCFPMNYFSGSFRFYSQSEQQRGFTWVEIPSSLQIYTKPDTVSGSLGSVILRPNQPTLVSDIEASDMSVLRIGLQHQTLEDWCWATTAAEYVTLAHPFTMTSTAAQYVTLPYPTVTLPYPSTVTATTTMTRTLTRITTMTRETALSHERLRPRRTRRELATPRGTGRSGLATPRRTGRTSRNAPRSHRWAARVLGVATAMEVDEVEEMNMQCDMWDDAEDYTRNKAAKNYYTY
ncbi:hypothetical protein E2C01_034595 [Portunus trituberculatus]|uniref:Uncharacterized protein n=1 Tax=Portunus trituberculatus TaxID=210409 RepID=A0A5B7F605_PORTR|nr:hypothetical protein [Portunus trituberculatus]